MLPTLRNGLWLALALATAGCSSDVAVQVVARPGWEHLEARPAGCKMQIYESHHELAEDCFEVGDVWIGDGGASNDCGFDRVVALARREACEYGADVAQMVSHHRPEFFGSSCHQVRVRLMRCRVGAPQ